MQQIFYDGAAYAILWGPWRSLALVILALVIARATIFDLFVSVRQSAPSVVEQHPSKRKRRPRAPFSLTHPYISFITRIASASASVMPLAMMIGHAIISTP